jgi:hypothetical protein
VGVPVEIPHPRTACTPGTTTPVLPYDWTLRSFHSYIGQLRPRIGRLCQARIPQRRSAAWICLQGQFRRLGPNKADRFSPPPRGARDSPVTTQPPAIRELSPRLGRGRVSQKMVRVPSFQSVRRSDRKGVQWSVFSGWGEPTYRFGICGVTLALSLTAHAQDDDND